MYTNLKYILITISILTGTTLCAQSKKDVKKNKIKSVKVDITTYKSGVEANIPVLSEKYDASGELIEVIDYDKEGKVKFHEAYKLDKNGDVVEKLEYATDGKLMKKSLMKYNASGDKTEESRFDGKGVFLNKEIYTYNAKGERTTEITMDPSNNVTKKQFHLYDKKGMRIESKTTDAKGVTVEIKKYSIEYY